MRRARAVVFDLDGTLSDSAPGLLASLRHMHAAQGWPVPSDDELRAWLGPPVSTSLRDRGHDAPAISAALAAFRAHLEAEGLADQRIYDGIPELLERLRAAGVPTAIATFKLQHDAVTVADHEGLAPLLGSVHGRIDAEEGHSKAPVIARALAAIGVAPGPDVVMVGDRSHDVRSASELGLSSVGVAYGYGGEEELRTAGATVVVHSVEELAATLLDA